MHRVQFTNFADAKHRAEHAAMFGITAYVNRLASSGPMQYEVSDKPMDTTFGGGTVLTVLPPAEKSKRKRSK